MIKVYPSAGGRIVWASVPVDHPVGTVTDAVMESGYVKPDRHLGLSRNWTENGQRWFEFKVTKKF